MSVGDIDLSGKTVEEATSLISQEYVPRFTDNSIVFYANEEASHKPQLGAATRETLDEQITYEESLASRDRWTIDAAHLGATFNPGAYAEMAYQVGREDGGFFSRLMANFDGVNIVPICTFNETAFVDFRDEIIQALGSKMVDFNIEMQGTHAVVTDGHDGYEVPEGWLIDRLNEGFLYTDGESSFIVDMQDVPIRIDREAAQTCADIIDASIPAGLVFEYDSQQWYADPDQLARWVRGEVKQNGDKYELRPIFDSTLADKAIIQGFGFIYGGSGHTVNFENVDGQIMVSTNATGTVPQVQNAIDRVNDSFFTQRTKDSAPVQKVEAAQIPESMTFDQARDYGLIVAIKSFTTKYASGAEARNNNIHIVSDALNDSICKAGGSWSFLELSGETTAEKGYKDAGAIVAGEYSDAIGGGICQVATTVFNAVYEAGYPIEKRYNHSLYIASYPEGRDAAISYPSMDLIWQNDTESDVLLGMSYTNSSVTATLYGVDPGYEVTTTYGEWQEGEPFKTIVRQDADYPVGTEFVESPGADGRSIVIIRIVKDKDGNVIRESEFASNYEPKNKIIVQGSAE